MAETMDPIPALVVTTGAVLVDAVDDTLLTDPVLVAPVEDRPANCCTITNKQTNEINIS